MAASECYLNIYSKDKTHFIVTVFDYEFERAGDRPTIWQILATQACVSNWITELTNLSWEILPHSADTYNSISPWDMDWANKKLYDATPAATVTGFFLDWTEYKIWWDEAAWWNITWTLSDQTDLQNALNSKQNTLTAQTAYTSKWTSSKVPQITTNSLWQVTWITEVDINYPSQIDNTAYWSSWNGVTNKAPTKDAVYDKINAMDWQISDLQAHWKFLSLWNSATWLPISFPLTTPYTYSTWDYYMVETLPSSGSKYMPNGSSYSGTASTTVDSVNEVKVWDMYIYDGSVWLYASNHWKDVTFSNIAWNPSDNTNLATALNGKQDTLSTQTAYTSKWTASKVPQITTNTLGQVTWITEVTITHPSQVSDTAYASSWDWVTDTAPSKNAVYDKISSMDTTISGKLDKVTWTASLDRAYIVDASWTQTTYNVSQWNSNNAIVRRSWTWIIVPDTPWANTHAVNKNYVDAAIAWITAWDMSYSDFNAVAKTWATVTMDLFSTITPSANFTVNAPSTIKEWQTYILRVTNESTAYTMTLWTNMTNPFETDLTLTDYWVDQFVFLAVGGKLELQPEWGGGWWWGWAITADTTWTETSISKIWVWTEEEYADLWTYEENVAYMTY